MICLSSHRQPRLSTRASLNDLISVTPWCYDFTSRNPSDASNTTVGLGFAITKSSSSIPYAPLLGSNRAGSGLKTPDKLQSATGENKACSCSLPCLSQGLERWRVLTFRGVQGIDWQRVVLSPQYISRAEHCSSCCCHGL